MQPQIHLIDETWIDAPLDTVSIVVADPANWRLWWPTLDLTVTRDRGRKGIQWVAVSSPGPSLAPVARRRAVAFRCPVAVRGTVEIWLEPFRTGVILHHYLRLDPSGDRPLTARAAARRTRQLAWQAKRVFWRLKDELEASR
ncbi:MAG: hypothetical protein M3Y42_19480 [Actinomycetota bacterium]|nr:hypothetical protein [Actinomycetota bacterium]MDQ2959125.1 hypothetical protein [Actinomycetota bacterium]